MTYIAFTTDGGRLRVVARSDMRATAVAEASAVVESEGLTVAVVEVASGSEISVLSPTRDA